MDIHIFVYIFYKTCLAYCWMVSIIRKHVRVRRMESREELSFYRVNIQ